MSFSQALDRAVNIVHKLDDDLDEARKELKDTKARNTTLVKGYTMLQEDNTKLKRYVQALGERLDSVQTERNSLKTGIDELKTRNRELQAHNEELQRRNKELEQKVNELVEKNDELQTTKHVLQHAHDTLAKDKEDIKMVAINRELQLDNQYAKTNSFQEKYQIIKGELLCRDKERCEAQAFIKKFKELWTDLFKAWEDACGSRADRRFKFGVSGVWKHLCDDIWCPGTPLPHSKAADSIRRYCPPVAGHKNADLRTRVRGIIDQASDLRNKLEKSQLRVHINPTLVRLEQDPYLSPTVVVFTSFGFAESLGNCNVRRTNPEAVSRDATV